MRINPNDKVNGEIVDLKSICDAIDTSSLRMVRQAIEKQNSTQFVSAYDARSLPPNAHSRD